MRGKKQKKEWIRLGGRNGMGKGSKVQETCSGHCAHWGTEGTDSM